MPNPFRRLELHTQNRQQAKDFYGSLFDWEFEDVQLGPEDGVYTIMNPSEGPGGGILELPNPDVPTAWTPFVSVDDADAYAEKAKSLGAEVVHGPVDIPRHGRIAIFVGPCGSVIGVVQEPSEEASE